MQTDVIDEKGKLFGVINIIDLLVVLVFVSVVIAGAALVFQSGAEATDPASEPVNESTTVVVETTVAPYVADAIRDGSPVLDDISSVGDVHVVDTIEVNDTQTGRETRYRVRFTATLVTQSDDNGLPEFRGERLYVGQTVRLDLGTTVVDGVVVDIRDW